MYRISYNNIYQTQGKLFLFSDKKTIDWLRERIFYNSLTVETNGLTCRYRVSNGGRKTQCLYLPDVQRSLSLKTNLMSGKRNVFKNSGNFGV